MKTAKVIPIFKKGDKNEISNYRPISLHSTFSKILEKLIFKRTRKFLDKHSIISSNQYGFRPSLSTTHAMLDVLTSTYGNISALLLLDLNKVYLSLIVVDLNRLYYLLSLHTITALLLLDLNKAFDTVQHDI